MHANSETINMPVGIVQFFYLTDEKWRSYKGLEIKFSIYWYTSSVLLPVFEESHMQKESLKI